MKLELKELIDPISEGATTETKIIFDYKDTGKNFDFYIVESKNLPKNATLKAYFLGEMLVDLGYRIQKILIADLQDDIQKSNKRI